MKRALAFFLCLILILAMTPALVDLRAEAETSGYRFGFQSNDHGIHRQRIHRHDPVNTRWIYGDCDR